MLPSTAPSVPADMKEVFSTELACSVQDFYRRFVAGSSDFSRRLHIQVWVRGYGRWEPWEADAWEMSSTVRELARSLGVEARRQGYACWGGQGRAAIRASDHQAICQTGRWLRRVGQACKVTYRVICWGQRERQAWERSRLLHYTQSLQLPAPAILSPHRTQPAPPSPPLSAAPNPQPCPCPTAPPDVTTCTPNHPTAGEA